MNARSSPSPAGSTSYGVQEGRERRWTDWIDRNIPSIDTTKESLPTRCAKPNQVELCTIELLPYPQKRAWTSPGRDSGHPQDPNTSWPSTAWRPESLQSAEFAAFFSITPSSPCTFASIIPCNLAPVLHASYSTFALDPQHLPTLGPDRQRECWQRGYRSWGGEVTFCNS